MVWMFEYRCYSTKITLRLGRMELEIFWQFLDEWDWRRFRFATHDGAADRDLS